jgi:hypothetical protein
MKNEQYGKHFSETYNLMVLWRKKNLIGLFSLNRDTIYSTIMIELVSQWLSLYPRLFFYNILEIWVGLYCEVDQSVGK